MNLKSTFRSHYQSVKFPTIMLGIAYYLYTLFVHAADMNEFVTNLLGNDVFTQWHEGILYGLVLLFVGRYFYHLVRYQQKGQFKPLYYSALLLLIMGVELNRDALPEPVGLNFLPLNIFYFALLVWGLLVLGAISSFFAKPQLLENLYTLLHRVFSFSKHISDFVLPKKYVNERTENSQQVPGFLKDAVPPSMQELDDELGRTPFVEKIAVRLLATPKENGSFSMGIEGPWGSGKSYTMALLKKELGDDVIPVDYHPWRYEENAGLVEAFFASLSKALTPYDGSLRRTLIRYSRHITQSVKLPFWQLTFAHGSNSESLFDKLNHRIRQLHKPVVVFIDDLDRLEEQEIMQVFKIIRNTANFDNLIFVAAYDFAYLDTVLFQRIDKVGANMKSELCLQYIKKIFQFEFSLPAVDKDYLIANLSSNLLDNEWLNSDEMNEVIKVFPGKEYISKSLNTPRAINCFVNQFNLSSCFISQELMSHSFFVFSLLKYNDVKTIRFLYDNSELVIGPNRDLEKLLEQVNTTDDNKKYLSIILDNQDGYLGSAKDFYKYYSLAVFSNDIGRNEFRELIDLIADMPESAIELEITDIIEKRKVPIETVRNLFIDEISHIIGNGIKPELLYKFVYAYKFLAVNLDKRNSFFDNVLYDLVWKLDVKLNEISNVAVNLNEFIQIREQIFEGVFGPLPTRKDGSIIEFLLNHINEKMGRWIDESRIIKEIKMSNLIHVFFKDLFEGKTDLEYDILLDRPEYSFKFFLSYINKAITYNHDDIFENYFSYAVKVFVNKKNDDYIISLINKIDDSINSNYSKGNSKKYIDRFHKSMCKVISNSVTKGVMRNLHDKNLPSWFDLQHKFN